MVTRPTSRVSRDSFNRASFPTIAFTRCVPELFLRPFGAYSFLTLAHGLRRGPHSFAALRFHEANPQSTTAFSFTASRNPVYGGLQLCGSTKRVLSGPQFSATRFFGTGSQCAAALSCPILRNGSSRRDGFQDYGVAFVAVDGAVELFQFVGAIDRHAEFFHFVSAR